MTTAAASGALVSIGYEGRDINDFVQLLVNESVDVLVDVRLNAISRKRGFAKTALTQALAEAGIGYRHERALGNPKENRAAFVQGEPEARNRYIELLGQGAGAASVDTLVRLCADQRVAVLCYEQEHATCHRSVVTARAKQLAPKLEILEV